MKKQRQPVYIKWVDSAQKHGWLDPSDVNKPIVVETIGWLVNDDEFDLGDKDGHACVSCSVHETEVLSVLAIPNCSICSILCIELDTDDEEGIESE